MKSREYENGSISVYLGPWHSLSKVLNCPCPDGKARVAVITGEADTFFSRPARVKAMGKTVTGYVTTTAEYKGEKEGLKFVPNKYGKNYSVFSDFD